MITKVTQNSFLCILFSMLLIVSCSDSENDPNPPTVTAPSDNSVLVGGSVDLSFDVSTEGGYNSATVTSTTNGEATITSEPEEGAPNGTVVVSFTGGSTAGAASVELTVTDQEGLNTDATAIVSVGEEQTSIRVTDNITTDQTWEDGKTYILGGRIAVEAGATLTIEGGTVIKGEEGAGSNASALIIARDATLNANGTADQPIIFTAIGDEITPEMIDNGNFGSPNLANDVNGRWGGVIVLGNAPIEAGSEETNIEGIPPSDTNGLYGGNDPEDSSGSITYVSIRHGGTDIGEGNEINGLSLGGVGSGTTVENIEIVANQDDGVEFFGGTVNVNNVLVWNNGDDAIDTDQGYTGTISNMVIVSPGGSVFELDGPESEAGTIGTAFTIQNGTVFVKGNNAELLIDTDENTNASISNILFFGLATNSDGSAANFLDTDYAEYAANGNGFAITSLQAVLPSGTALGDYFPSALIDAGEVSAVADVSAATVGATDLGAFNFTWASNSGALAEIGLQ